MKEHETDGKDPYSIVKADQIATLFSIRYRSCGMGYHDVMCDCGRDSWPTSDLRCVQVVSRPASACKKRSELAERNSACSFFAVN